MSTIQYCLILWYGMVYTKMRKGNAHKNSYIAETEKLKIFRGR